VRSAKFRPIYKQVYWLLLIDVIALGYLGSQPPKPAFVAYMQLATAYYFFHFLVLLPLLGKFEKTRPLPTSISTPVLQGGGTTGTSRPMEKA
jgi:quinol-cytochrome oxidoreductase complex cytochrome b subunit